MTVKERATLENKVAGLRRSVEFWAGYIAKIQADIEAIEAQLSQQEEPQGE